MKHRGRTFSRQSPNTRHARPDLPTLGAERRSHQAAHRKCEHDPDPALKPDLALDREPAKWREV